MRSKKYGKEKLPFKIKYDKTIDCYRLSRGKRVVLTISLAAIHNASIRKKINSVLDKFSIDMDWARLLKRKPQNNAVRYKWGSIHKLISNQSRKLEELRKKYSSCNRCDLCQTRTNVVFGSGSADSKIILIGEAPGSEEDKSGIPFCGKSGELLTEFLNGAGLNRKEIFITNVVCCRPPNNRDPNDSEIESCNARLTDTIKIIQPKIIVLIGNYALETILGITSIKKRHGKIYWKGETMYIPCLHPAWFLRNRKEIQKGFNLFRQVSKYLKCKKLPISKSFITWRF